MKKVELSVVTTLYRSSEFIVPFIEALEQSITEAGFSSYEVIIVNDGSPDDSYDIAKKAIESREGYLLIDLSRNFGHHHAFFAGMTYSSGDLIFNIDSDMETHPSELVRFAEVFERESADVVYGYQAARRGGLIERITGGAFWWAINKLGKTKIPPNITTERLMSRRYVNALCSLKEINPFLGGLMYWVGFEQVGISISRTLRDSKSSYSLTKKMELLLDAITSMSGFPLRIVFKMGMLLILFSLVFGGYLFTKKILYPEQILQGYTSLIIIILFSAGIVNMSVGLVGLYIERVFNEVKNRPNYIVRTTIDKRIT